MTRSHRPTRPAPQVVSGRSALDPLRLDDVAGYRVVRRLAVGSRATLLLAQASRRGEDGNPSLRILKVFGAGTSAASIDVELAALGTDVIPHVVRLLDIASLDEGAPPCLVLERLPGPSLSTYLGQTNSLSAGQAVTMLAPLCSSIQALHDVGVTHGAIHLRRIVFDNRGAPTLTGFGRGVLRQSPETRHSGAWPGGRVRTGDPTHSTETLWRDAVAADQHDLLDVVDEVLAHVDAERMPPGFDMAQLARAIDEGPRREFLPELERALFAIAPAQVVSVAATGSEDHSQTPARPHRETPDPTAAFAQNTEYDWSQSTPAPAPAPSENRLVAALRILGMSSAGLELASSAVDVAARFTKREREQSVTPPAEEATEARNVSKRWRRKPLLVGASCAVLATTALLLVLPAPNDGAQAGGDATSSSGAPAGDPPPEEATPSAIPHAESTLRGDDPAAALQMLSLVNDGCAAAAEPEACLATVFQEDFLESRPPDEPSHVIEANDAVVTGSWGGSALVSAHLNGQPASFLLLKGEAGWRVRDIFVSD